MQGSTGESARGASAAERPGTIVLTTHPAGPSGGERDSGGSAGEREAMRLLQYRRTVRADRPRAFAALAGVVQLLRYPVREEDPDAAQIRFLALARTVTASVIEARPGHCTVVVEFVSLRWLGSGASALVILPGVLLGAAVKAQDAWFAKGFMDNVQRVLEGKGVGRDSARLPWVTALRKSLDIAER